MRPALDNNSITSYPLHWPPGKTRTPLSRRVFGRFEARAFGLIRDEMLHVLELLGATDLIVSSNMPCKSDGMPYANSPEPGDGGIAIYFTRRKKPYVLACDTYDKAWKNLRAITKTIEALRTIERHGSTEMMEQAFTGFTALPAHAAEASWWDTLGVTPEASSAQIEAAHQRLALKHHPDVGGDTETMARINRARDRALEERQ